MLHCIQTNKNISLANRRRSDTNFIQYLKVFEEQQNVSLPVFLKNDRNKRLPAFMNSMFKVKRENDKKYVLLIVLILVLMFCGNVNF